MNKYQKHLITVLRHKRYVFQACRDCGVPWRGIKHDLSKFSITEFKEYAENYVDGRSPVDEAKRKYGYSAAWQHHMGRNTHHWQYWIDWTNGKPVAVTMPYLDQVELLCDWIGAGKAYNKEAWTNNTPLEYYNKVKDTLFMSVDSKDWLKKKCESIAEIGWEKTASYIKYYIKNAM